MCILGLEIAMKLPSSFGVHRVSHDRTWAELRPWTVPCPRLPDICWLAKSRLRTCRRHRRLQELNALSILKFALERLTTWTSESSTRIVFLASAQEIVLRLFGFRLFLECWRLELERVRILSRRPQRDTDSEYENTAKVPQVSRVSWDKMFLNKVLKNTSSF